MSGEGLTGHTVLSTSWPGPLNVMAGLVPAIRRGTAPANQPPMHRARAVLTLYEIVAEILAFTAVAPASRASTDHPPHHDACPPAAPASGARRSHVVRDRCRDSRIHRPRPGPTDTAPPPHHAACPPAAPTPAAPHSHHRVVVGRGIGMGSAQGSPVTPAHRSGHWPTRGQAPAGDTDLPPCGRPIARTVPRRPTLTLHEIDAEIRAFVAYIPARQPPATSPSTAPAHQPHPRRPRSVLTVHSIDVEILGFVARAPARRVPATSRGTAPARQAYPRRPGLVLTVRGIDVEILAFAAFASSERVPATSRGTAPARQAYPRRARPVLTVHSIDVEILGFVARAPARRVPATSRRTAPAHQPHPRRPRPVLTVHSIEVEILGLVAFTPSERAPATSRGTWCAPARRACVGRAPFSRFIALMSRFSGSSPSPPPSECGLPIAPQRPPARRARVGRVPFSRFIGLMSEFSDSSPSRSPSELRPPVAARCPPASRVDAHSKPSSRFMRLMSWLLRASVAGPADAVPSASVRREVHAGSTPTSCPWSGSRRPVSRCARPAPAKARDLPLTSWATCRDPSATRHNAPRSAAIPPPSRDPTPPPGRGHTRPNPVVAAVASPRPPSISMSLQLTQYLPMRQANPPHRSLSSVCRGAKHQPIAVR